MESKVVTKVADLENLIWPTRRELYCLHHLLIIVKDFLKNFTLNILFLTFFISGVNSLTN